MKSTSSKVSPSQTVALDPLSNYRQGMRVTELMVFSYSGGKTGYYVCPRCKATMEREFMAFCDRCGQKLDWRGYKKAKIILL